MDRREFVIRVGALALVLPAARVVSGCGGGDGGVGGGGGNGTPTPSTVLSFTSSVEDGHTHQVSLRREDITSPPAGGVEPSTTEANAHVHRVVLTAADLDQLDTGATVEKQTTTELGHLHTFRFTVASGGAPSGGGNGGGGGGY